MLGGRCLAAFTVNFRSVLSIVETHAGPVSFVLVEFDVQVSIGSEALSTTQSRLFLLTVATNEDVECFVKLL